MSSKYLLLPLLVASWLQQLWDIVIYNKYTDLVLDFFQAQSF